jgi:mono/diheme cytochrome c family protein
MAKKLILGGAALLVVLVLVAITMVGWQVVLGPKARATSAAPFEVTEARLARGKYLVEGPLHCFLCHTEHDFSQPEYPTIAAKKGAGWVMPIPELNNIAARNITPDKETGLGDWTDDEIARAIREGVRKDGTALFPVMPYLEFAKLDDEDVKSIVVYLRTLTPVRNVVPVRSLPGPLEWIVNTIPVPLTTPQPSHPSSTAVERGAYLVPLAGCPACHTPAIDGEPAEALTLAGGGVFDDPGQGGKKVFSANITFDPSGIQHYDASMLRETLRTGRMGGRLLNHIMPFESFKNLTDEDIDDIFAYLKSQPPVKHRINNIDPPTMCVVCGQSHGLGESNVKTTGGAP